MSGFGKRNAEELRVTLEDAIVKCSERCLYQSAKWAAEMSSSLSNRLDDSDGDTDIDSPMEDAEQLSGALPIIISANSDPEEARMEAKEIHKYLLARSFFDCKEFERCAAVFLPSGLPKGSLSAGSNVSTRSPLKSGKGKSKEVKSAVSSSVGNGAIPPPNVLPRLSQKALFLSLYAKYMAGEKRKEEDSEMILGPVDRGSAVNKELIGISRSLEGWFATKSPEDSTGGWLEYLYGIVLAKGKNEEDAKRWLIRSVHMFPYNWGAWLELNDLLGSMDELRGITPELPQNIMTLIFLIYARQELYQCSDQEHSQLNDLENIFPENHFLMTQRALLYYHNKDFDDADSLFTTIIHNDPHRIDSLDHYSNLLFVMGARPKLAFLAQLATATDKFRPETCCVVGNYYSLKSEHEKAVNYFRRALTLDRNFLSAWTLMGHEYLEMKNTHAAIESYRRAVDINRKDYRAWYGLGQTYEILEMHLYALFYHQRASSLRPYDPKMWQAVGNCYDKTNRPIESIKAYKRALVAGSYYDTGSSFGSGSQPVPSANGIMDPEILYQIALMYEKLGELEEAASYMEMTLVQEEGPAGEEEDEEERRGAGAGTGTGVTNTTSKARMWLARWEFGRGGLERAMELCNELCMDGVEVEEAKALIRDVRARMEGNHGE